MSYKNKLDKICSKLMYKYINALLSDDDLTMLRFMFSNEPSQCDFDKLLETYDVNEIVGYKALMFAYFKDMNSHLDFSKCETFPYKNALHNYKLANLKLTSSYMKLGKLFANTGIDLMILKGFAMKYLRPSLSRSMGDIDVLVPENQYVKTIKMCQDLGYRLDIFVHSIDIHEPNSDAGVMDIHRYIDMKNRKERPLNKFLFERAKETVYSGVKTLVPSNSDLFFLSLINLALNLKEKTSKASTLFALFDCKYLLEQPDFDMNIVIDNMNLTSTYNEIAFAIKFINMAVPDLIPNSLAHHEKVVKAEYITCLKILFNDRFYGAFSKLNSKNKLKAVIKKEKSLSDYIKLKTKFHFCKSLRKHRLHSFKTSILTTRKYNNV